LTTVFQSQEQGSPEHQFLGRFQETWWCLVSASHGVFPQVKLQR
jgi:hypothetical protein